MTLIRKSGFRAEQNCYFPTLYAGLRLGWGIETPEFRPTSLNEAINRALADLMGLVKTDNINVIIPDGLPLVKTVWDIERVFIWLLDAREYRYYLRDNQLTILIQGREQNNIAVSIQAEQIILEGGDLDRFFQPGLTPSAARLIVQQHDKELLVFNMKQRTVIEFELPIWDESLTSDIVR